MMGNFGAIYIAHNPRDGDHIYKVGMTERDVEFRMAELTASTSNLGRYSVCAYFVVRDTAAAEYAVHSRLRENRLQDNREFFEIELPQLLALVREAVEPFEAQNVLPELDTILGVRKEETPRTIEERIKARVKRMEESVDGKEERESREREEGIRKLEELKADLRQKVKAVRAQFQDVKILRWGDTSEPGDSARNTVATCPHCGWTYGWDGRRCGHCNYPYQDGLSAPPNSNRSGITSVMLLADADIEPVKLKFRTNPAYMYPQVEDFDDGRVAEVWIVFGVHRIAVKVDRIRYDGTDCSWKRRRIGEAVCQEPRRYAVLASSSFWRMTPPTAWATEQGNVLRTQIRQPFTFLGDHEDPICRLAQTSTDSASRTVARYSLRLTGPVRP